jgi:hypothetical protein
LKGFFIAKYRAIQHRLEKKNPGFSFSDCLVIEVKGFLRNARDKVTQDKVTRDQASQEIDWQKFDMYLKSADHRFDILVELVYLELKRLSFEDPYNIVGVIECLKTLFTISDKEWNEVENAFGQAPQGHQASQGVYEEIVGFLHLLHLFCNPRSRHSARQLFVLYEYETPALAVRTATRLRKICVNCS